MWAPRYWTTSYWTGRYWPPGGTQVPVVPVVHPHAVVTVMTVRPFRMEWSSAQDETRVASAPAPVVSSRRSGARTGSTKSRSTTRQETTRVARGQGSTVRIVMGSSGGATTVQSGGDTETSQESKAPVEVSDD